MTRKTMARFRRARLRRLDEIARGGRSRLLALSRRFVLAFRAAPRASLAAAGLILAGFLVGLIPSEHDEDAATRVAVIELPAAMTEATVAADIAHSTEQRNGKPSDGTIEQPVDTTTHESDPESWKSIEVRSGQTLERIFRDLGLSATELHHVVHASEKTRKLARIRPGDEFAFDIDANGDFRALRAEFDEESWLFVERNGKNFEARTQPRELDRRIVEASGTIATSLYRAARDAELSDNMIMRLAHVFGWDIDFALDIRAGDRFALIYEEVWRDGEYLRDGPILAARFVNQGELFNAVRFDGDDGPDYYAPDGMPMRKAFLRAPLNFTRVTSNFNPRRYHPVTRQTRPHNGTDYGAPTGTPVWASGDGRVIESSYNNANGHYVFIRHGNNIVTKYLHLSRREVRRGDRVRQGETIGRVGATGLATGPHLHYEFLVNGVHRNPRTVDLPPADPLPEEHMDAFNRKKKGMIARLDTIDQPHLLMASAEEGCEQSGGSC